MTRLGWVSAVVLILPLASSSLAAGFDPPECIAGPFTDVPPSHPYCAWIQQLKLDAVTSPSGCGGGNYCPDAPVTRAQLAMHLERAVRGTATWDPPGTFKRTLIVRPVLSGDPPVVDQVASGAHLMSVLDSIPNNNDPWMVQIEPGIYDVGADSFTQINLLLVIKGAPGPATIIKGSLTSGAFFATDKNLWLQDVGLLVAGSGVGDLIALHNIGGNITLDGAFLGASGTGDAYGLRVDGGGVTGRDSLLEASSTSSLAAAAFVNNSGSNLTLRTSHLQSFSGDETRALLVEEGFAQLSESTFGVGNGTSNSHGVHVDNSGQVSISGGNGVANDSPSVALYVERGAIRVNGGSFQGDIAAQCAFDVNSDLTVIRATLNGSPAFKASAGCDAEAGFTRLEGFVDPSDDVTIRCLAVTNAGTFYPSTCP